jgi:hypothetical protein
MTLALGAGFHVRKLTKPIEIVNKAGTLLSRPGDEAQ